MCRWWSDLSPIRRSGGAGVTIGVSDRYPGSEKRLEMREEARAKIAKGVVVALLGVVVFTIIIGSVLLAWDNITFTDMITLISVVAGLFSGLAGSAITFYFANGST